MTGSDHPSPANLQTQAVTGLNDRRRQILAFARAHGAIEVETLADKLEVTPQTIRRDLAELCEIRLLKRVHGGAVLNEGISNLGYEARRRLMVAEKQAIAKAAAELVPSDSSLFVNIGTTTEAVVREIATHPGMLVVTNNINVIEILRSNETVTLMMAGGKLRLEDGGIVGKDTAEYIEQFRLDRAVIGVSALEEDGTLLDFDTQEVSVAKAIIANSRSVILVCDSSKFSRSAPMRIGNISAVDYLVTDSAPSTSLVQHCKANGVELVVAVEQADESPATQASASDIQ